jgi:hypothetical protein
MGNITKTYKHQLPALRFIGKKYTESNPYGHWGDFWSNNWFGAIEDAMGGVAPIQALWEDGGGYVGMERRDKDNALLEYWIGMFTPAETPVPEGLDCKDFPASNLGVSWIYGKEGEVHGFVGECVPALEAAGFEIAQDDEGTSWQFENGTCPRFTSPDEKGNVILDYCFFVK